MDFLTVKGLATEAINSTKLIEQLVSQIKTSVADDKLTDPAFCDLIFLLESIISTEDVTSARIHEVLDVVCLPILFKIHPSFDSRVENLALLTTVSSLCGACLVKAEETRAESLIDQCLELLERYYQGTDHQFEDGETLDIYCCVSVLQHLSKHSKGALSSSLQSKLLQAYFSVVKSVKIMKNGVLINMALNYVRNFINVSVEGRLDRLLTVWELICKEFDEGNEKPYILLCGMANHFFPVDIDNLVLDLKCKDDFWRIIQQGLSRTTPSSRKQSMYLLKRVTDICHSCRLSVESESLFKWNPKGNSLMEVWEDYILLLETLEETQVYFYVI
jgi:hypothetical protein